MAEKRRGWGWNWRKSPPHLALLTTFLLPRMRDDHPPLPNDLTWHAMLGELPEIAVERFLVQGVLEQCNDPEVISRLTVDRLRHILRTNELKVSGRKDDLISRILDAHVQLLHCSDYGRPVAEEYLENPEESMAAGLTLSVVREILKWVALAAAGGVIENLAWNALKETMAPATQTTPPGSATPTDTPPADPTSTPDKIARLVEEIRNGRKKLSDVDLRAANLNEVDLSQAILVGADLRQADLREADLRQADLRKANLSHLRAETAAPLLIISDPRGADLRGADLRGANLSWANLSWADLRGADLRKANLSGADLRDATLPDGSKYSTFSDLSEFTGE